MDVRCRRRTTSYVQTYDVDVRHRILGTYDIVMYDVVRLTYDIVCSIRCRRFYIRHRMLHIVCDIVCFDQHIVCSQLHIVCDIAYDIVYDVSIHFIRAQFRGIRNSILHSISGSLSHTPASASTTMQFNNWTSPSRPGPPLPPPHPGHSPGPALPMHFLRLVGPQNRAACWKLWRSCAAAAAAAWRGGDRHGCTVLQPVMLCAASTGDALLGGSCCCKVVKHAVAVMVASGDGHGVVAVRLHCWSLKFAHVDDVLEYWCSNEDMIFQLSWVQETMSCLSSNW